MSIKIIFLSILLLLSNFSLANDSLEKGNWVIVAEFGCSEIQNFDGDSLMRVKSGEQRLTKDYFILKLDQSEFYKFETIVTENNGKSDCVGQYDSKIGSQLNLYFKFNEDKNEMHFYFLPDEEQALGIYLKKID